MIFVSDVHGAAAPLAKLLSMGKPTIILGDLVNLTDYRNGEGAIADVLGSEFAHQSAVARAEGDFKKMRSLWAERAGSDADQLRAEIGAALDTQYTDMAEAMNGGSGYVIHGNVDRPKRLVDSLPGTMTYIHGETVEIEGMTVGLVGGGIETPMAADGEVSDGEMNQLLDSIGPVDVLCTHVPPALAPLRRDVITGREERGSDPILRYIVEHQPRFHFYGDVHQAQAAYWRVGKTRCHNAGYFRATGRYLELEGAMVQMKRLG